MARRGLLGNLPHSVGIGLLLAAAAALAGGTPVDLPSSEWNSTGTGSVSIKKVGKDSGPATGVLFFGPNGGLGPDEFLLSIDDGVEVIEVEGTYAEPKPGKPVLMVDNPSLAEELTDLVDAQIGPGDLPPGATFDISISKTKSKAKAKNKNGVETIKIKLKAQGLLTVMFGGESAGVKMKVGYSGAGSRAP